MAVTKRMSIGLIGCGAIGSVLADYISKDKEMDLTCIFDADAKNSRGLSSKLKKKPRAVKSPGDMKACDLVIEAASQDAVREHALGALEHSDLMIMSVGALSDSALFNSLRKRAKETGRHIHIPSGAIAGLDGIKAAGMGKIDKVTLTTRKPPAGLEGAPYIVDNGISLRSMKKPTVVFEGNAKQAAAAFPKNINVAVSLSLAGIGVEKTKVRIIADPFSVRNVHEIVAEGRFGKLTAKTENLPSPKNKKTSYLAALSAIATLDRIRRNVVAGT